jgi:hypothetical protein
MLIRERTCAAHSTVAVGVGEALGAVVGVEAVAVEPALGVGLTAG